MRPYQSIQKTATGKGDDYTAGFLLNYPYFKKYYKRIAIDLSKQKPFDAEPKATKKIYFTGNIDQ